MRQQKHLLPSRLHFVYDDADDWMHGRRPNGVLKRHRILFITQSDYNTTTLQHYLHAYATSLLTTYCFQAK